MTRYLENRAATITRLGVDLPQAQYEVLDELSESALNAALDRLSADADVIVVDTPGRDDPVARAAILRADTLVTPMNDSFVDLDLIGQVDPDSFKITKPSFYAELIWNSRTERAKASGKSVDWVVLRNRLQHIDSHNLRRVTFFCFVSSQFVLRFIAKISIQKEEVRAVIAPSALGNKADINAMIKITDTNGGICFKAISGNNLSPVTATFWLAAYKYNKPPKNKNNSNTIINIKPSVNTFF